MLAFARVGPLALTLGTLSPVGALAAPPADPTAGDTNDGVPSALSLSPREAAGAPEGEAAPDSKAAADDAWVDPQPDHWAQAEAEANASAPDQADAQPPSPTVDAGMDTSSAAPAPEPAPAPPATAPGGQRPVLTRAPPKQGSGLLAGGATLAGSGLLSIVSGTVVMRNAGGNEELRRSGVINASIGAAFMGVGAALFVPGALRRRKFLDYGAKYAVSPPGNGNGFFASGGYLGGSGALNALSLLATPRGTPQFTTTLAIAGTQVVGGIILASVGAFRRSRYQRWKKKQHWSVTAI